MKLWAIKRPCDGAFLPEVRKGYTYSEPRFDLPPRLFTSKGAAKVVLIYWLRGWYSTVVTTRRGFDDEFVDVERKVTKVDGRAEQGLEVVCMNLKEVSK